MTVDTDILIVGAGHSGAQAAIGLRNAHYDGRITVLGDEDQLPYERPPLSKDYLAGEKSFERLLIRQQAFWLERKIDIVTKCKVTAVDPQAHTVFSEDGSAYRYQHLIWAAGGRARTLDCPGAKAKGVFTVRTRDDADHLAAALPTASSVVIVGGGYVGLETAAVLRKLGKRVTLLESGSRVLSRVAGEALSMFYEDQHRQQGVDVRLNVQIEALELDSSNVVEGVRLCSGEVIPADVVVVGIGIIPNAEPLLAAGAAGGNGVWVDEYCRTSLSDIYAIGDAALHASIWCDGAPTRIESVQNAADMATTVALSLTGTFEPYGAIPWFWSQQYDLKLQTVGLSKGYDEAVMRGDPVERSFSVIYLKQGKVIAMDCVNAMKDFVQGKGLVQAGALIPASKLSDIGISLKSMV